MTDYERIEKVIKWLEQNYILQPTLKELSENAGVSEFHFQRLFSRWTGTTPKSFVQFLTAKHAKQLLNKSKDLLNVSLETGLSGPGRLHDLLISMEAMSPGEFKSKGEGVEIYYGIHKVPFGKCLIGITKRGICHLVFIVTNDEEAISGMKSRWLNATFKFSMKETAKVVKSIFEESGQRKIKLLVQGSNFQIKVWEALLNVPEGSVISYKRLAKLAGFPRASRAVGTAIGQNSIAYLIPCHRVIRETGVFGQYRWGTSRKRALLVWEHAREDEYNENE